METQFSRFYADISATGGHNYQHGVVMEILTQNLLHRDFDCRASKIKTVHLLTKPMQF